MLDKSVYDATVSKAQELVRHFVGTHAVRPESLIVLRSDGKPDRSVRDFGHYVVLTELKEKWGTTGYMSFRVAESTPLFVSMPVDSLDPKPQHLLGYASWFYGIRSSPRTNAPPAKPAEKQIMRGVYASVFDEAAIGVAGRMAYIDPRYLTIRLYYHELGHFIFHRDKLFDANPASSKSGGSVNERASKSTAEMECQAWIFSMAVIGLAMADHAFALRSAKKPDDAWVCPSHVPGQVEQN